jgi:hypothetical protein
MGLRCTWCTWSSFGCTCFYEVHLNQVFINKELKWPRVYLVYFFLLFSFYKKTKKYSIRV